MSYEIIYGKQFIKLNENAIIPMVLAGSNNCYDVDNRRSRNYCTMYPYLSSTGATGTIFDTPKNLIERATAGTEETVQRYAGVKKRWHNENDPPPTAEQVKKAYGYYTSLQIGSSTRGTTAGMYINLYKDGCKKALTIEQLNEIGINLKFSTYISCFSDEKPSIPQPEENWIKTTEEFYKEYEKWMQWKKECIITDESQKQFKPPVYLSFAGDHDSITDRLKRHRERNKPEPKPKTEVVQDHYFALKNENGFLIKYTRRGSYRYNYSTGGSEKRFESEGKAQKFIDGLKYKDDNWRVVRIEQRAKFLKVA